MGEQAKNWLNENWFKLGLLAIGLVVAHSLYQALVLRPRLESEEAIKAESRKQLEENNRRVEAEQTAIEKAKALANDPKSDSYIVTYDKDGAPLDWSTLDRAAVIMSDTLNTYTTSLHEFKNIQDNERPLISRMYGALTNTSIPEDKVQLQTLINYYEDYIASGEKLIGLLGALINNYQSLLKVIEERDPGLYLYYSKENDKLAAQKKNIIDDYVNKQNAKQNYAKSMLSQ